METDDMRGDVDELPALQIKIISDVCAWSTAKRFIVCPTYYSYDSRLAREFGPPPKTYLRDFGRMLDPGIDVFWTGEKIISDGYSARHIAEVAAVAGLAINPMNQPHLSRIALCGYKKLLGGLRKQVLLSNVCWPLAGGPFAERLAADCDLFQLKGLEQIDTDTRRRLLGLYEAENTNPHAQEVSAWLRGEYVFDPQCLTT